MTAIRARPGMSWIVTGGVLALVGLAIILWPELGFTLALGLIIALAGALRAAVAAARSHRR